MSGAEAAFIVGLISGVISIIEATKTVYDAAKDSQGQPEAFRQVAARLPLVVQILHKARVRAQALDETEQEALEPTLESCKTKAEALQKIFQKVARKGDDKWYDRYKKAAVGTLGKQGKVEGLMEGILKDIQFLACEKLMGTATDAEMNEIKEAMKEMKDMPSSLQDETGDALQQQHSGSGDNIGATGESVLNLHKGTGDQYHTQVAGNAQIGGKNISNYYSNKNPFDRSNRTCLEDLRMTADPREDMKRIMRTKGNLLKDSYSWILKNPDFQTWCNDQQSRLLWIKGEPGKGKTMLLRGIIKELGSLTTQKAKEATTLLSYFFCQATDSRINKATAVLSGLIYLLIVQQPTLVKHAREKYDEGAKKPFEGVNAWDALSMVFEKILHDPRLKPTYLIVDALDECEVDQLQLLELIVQSVSKSPQVKWIVSSRNWLSIEEQLERAEHKMILSLELNAESVSAAVSVFIQQKVSQLAQKKKYSTSTFNAVLAHLTLNANDTFLWVALVCQNLQGMSKRNVLEKLDSFPPRLDALYKRMMQQISLLHDAELCKQILAFIALVYRPVKLEELVALSKPLDNIADELDSIREVIGLCGSFLTLRDDMVYFVHQSAKDFLLAEAAEAVFPSGTGTVHHAIFVRSLQVMSKTLRRDMYGLKALGYPADEVKQPDPDPLAPSRYSCIHWVNHLCDSNPTTSATYVDDLQNGGVVDEFLRGKYLYWLEALSLCKSMPGGVASIAKLRSLVQGRRDETSLVKLISDAYRFIMYHKPAIESSPLQAYASALLFSPTGSLIRSLFKHEEPKWIKIRPAMEDSWSACLQTLEGHSSWVSAVAFSPDGKQLASASNDKTVRLWDAGSGAPLRTLEGHSSRVRAVAFSPNGKQLASASNDKTVRLWDAGSGALLQALDVVGSVLSLSFSADSTSLQTNTGSFSIPNSSFNSVDVSKLQFPFSILVKDQWVGRHTQQILWLPPEYRPDVSAIYNSSIVGLGHSSGRVSFIEFSC